MAQCGLCFSASRWLLKFSDIAVPPRYGTEKHPDPVLYPYGVPSCGHTCGACHNCAVLVSSPCQLVVVTRHQATRDPLLVRTVLRTRCILGIRGCAHVAWVVQWPSPALGTSTWLADLPPCHDRPAAAGTSYGARIVRPSPSTVVSCGLGATVDTARVEGSDNSPITSATAATSCQF